ncbi:sensor histidine kinase [Marinivivus vitaminiproducens]|uniref:sensor histidine kinase n=1 Tax=Marinivivus vitaminiproducens TaxID=3035935 RepID=UPI0027AAA213|nr:HAMP domain-containing sensor histidine kinase [Geminicoccaceae bacterium SCSIO 64248]
MLLADGLARFLGQPRYSWIGIALLLFQVVTWSLAVAVDPANVAMRIHASTFFTVVMMSVMCLGLMRDQTQPWLLRWITIAVLAEYMAASVAHSALNLWRLSTPLDVFVVDDRSAWYVLQGNLFLIAFFVCLLFMVTSRLSADLRATNEALTREVQDRRRLESQLHASLEAERALREEQADFMHIVAHEFRTPLAVIRNASDMIGLVGNRDPQKTRDRLAGIGEALDRLFSLIDRFMTNGRDNGFQPEQVQVGDLIAGVQLHFDLTGRGERLVFVMNDNAVSTFADPEMLMTVIINLIDNALKYSTPDQNVRINTTVKSGSIVIEVIDHGIGIPPRELPKVGRRFFRASNTTAGTGTGLGLYSSRKLLAYHGGKLDLHRNDERGMTATIRVPLSRRAVVPRMHMEQTP